MINDKYSRYDSKIREKLGEVLDVGSDDKIVTDVLDIIRKDYVLLAKNDLSCKDCFNFQDNTKGNWMSSCPYYCKYYQKQLYPLHMSANDCNHYLSGEWEARKSIAKLHYDLTGEDIL